MGSGLRARDFVLSGSQGGESRVASFVLKRLGPRKTDVRFLAKRLSSPEPPREMTNAILADYTRGLETMKMLCENA